MSLDLLLASISAAFAARRHPGRGNITCCTLSKRFGGTLDGACWECEAMEDYFGGKSWTELTGSELRKNGDNDSLFTVPAYCYFLPAYLSASVREPKQLDICVEHLEYRFGPKAEDSFGVARLSELKSELNGPEQAAVVGYFRFALERDGNFEGYCERAVKNMSASTNAL
jgi:hypothetical protein